MGTHPIFETDLDCLTENKGNQTKMNAWRNTAYRLATKVTQQTVKPTQLVARALAGQLAKAVAPACPVHEQSQQQQLQAKLFTVQPKSKLGARIAQLNFNLPQPESFTVSFASQMGASMSRIFAAFDLMSVSVTLIGYIGDAAVWLVQDKLTGDVQYVVDDSM